MSTTQLFQVSHLTAMQGRFRGEKHHRISLLILLIPNIRGVVIDLIYLELPLMLWAAES